MRLAGKESESYGTLKDGARLSPATMFDDVFKEMSAHLAAQRTQARL